MSPAYSAALDLASQVLTGLFAFEIVAKLLALGTWGFFSDGFNAFDLLVVVAGLLEMGLMVRALLATLPGSLPVNDLPVCKRCSTSTAGCLSLCCWRLASM